MKLTHLTLAAVLIGGAGASSVAQARQRQPAAHASRATVLDVRRTNLGRVLVSASGRTLYEFTRDRADRDSCAAISGCPQVWPALLSGGRPAAGAGVRSSLLSTIRLAGGARQLVYAGHPLYLYSGDGAPGETSYVGARQFGGSWYAIDPNGGAVR